MLSQKLFYLGSNDFAQNTRYKTSMQIIPFGELSHNLFERVTL